MNQKPNTDRGLLITFRIGDRVFINEEIGIECLNITGKQVRIRFSADKDKYNIVREKAWDKLNATK